MHGPDGLQVEEASGGRGRPTVASTSFSLTSLGDRWRELLVEGVAAALDPVEALEQDGRWICLPGEQAPFRTRVVIYEPLDGTPGTTFVEWLNVSGGLDAAPTWSTAHLELIRSHARWVGVSAQQAGVTALRGSDPDRYGALHHPGDAWSYDIYRQVLALLRHEQDDGHLIATGESQSAWRLVTWLNTADQPHTLLDAALIHSRCAIAAPVSQAPCADVPAPDGAGLRTDLAVPVLVVQAETDLFLRGHLRQDDSPTLREWEIAGAAHADLYTLLLGGADAGDGVAQQQLFDGLITPTSAPIPGIIECARPINTGPQHWVLQAAVQHVRRWAEHGQPPPPAPRLQLDPDAEGGVARDADGIALGGVRSPHVDAPLAALSGTGQPRRTTGCAGCPAPRRRSPPSSCWRDTAVARAFSTPGAAPPGRPWKRAGCSHRTLSCWSARRSSPSL
jgi:hypothetical protein